MQRLLSYAKTKKSEIVTAIGEMVECESPSDSPPDLNRFADLLVERTKDIAVPAIFETPHGGKHVRLDFRHGGKGTGRILALGHSDTVWPLGTLTSMPFQQRDGWLWGPGVLDMKGGLALFLYAVRALYELDVPLGKRLSLLVVSDEETGSATSRAITENEARQSDCVLVLEPGTGLTGKLKTARKGIAEYRLKVTGVAAHAGVDFANGASAIVEMSHQIQRIAVLTDLHRGTTVNPGVLRGGTRTNVIASNAEAEIDVRVKRLEDFTAIDRELRALQPVDWRCTLSIEGDLNRPPMERTEAIAKLFEKAKQVGAEMGIQLEESSTGGGSDGNFTAALGVPTLDGLGAVGEGAHASHESMLTDRIEDRTALLAGLLSRL